MKNIILANQLRLCSNSFVLFILNLFLSLKEIYNCKVWKFLKDLPLRLILGWPTPLDLPGTDPVSNTNLRKKPKCSALGQKSYSGVEVRVNCVLTSICYKNNNPIPRRIILNTTRLSVGILLKQFFLWCFKTNRCN